MLIVHLGDTQCDSPTWETVRSRWITLDDFRARPNFYTKLGKNLKNKPLNMCEIVYTSIFHLTSPSSAGLELQNFISWWRKNCKNSSNMPQDIFWIDPTQIKAKTSEENFSCGSSSPVLQVCEMQIMNDKHLKFWTSTNVLLLYSPFTVQDSQHQSKTPCTLRKPAWLDSQSSTNTADCSSISDFID